MSLFKEVFKNDGLKPILDEYTQSKVEQLKYAKMLKKMKKQLNASKNKVNRAFSCNQFVDMVVSKDMLHHKVVKAFYCNQMLCPTCTKIRSQKLALELATCVQKMQEDGYLFLFVTLTVENCQGDDLKEVITLMNRAYANMTKTVRFAFVQGYFRKLEVTYNKEDNTYHPHFHCLFAVHKSYFKNPKYYMTQAELVERWSKAAKKVGLPVRNHLIADIRKMGTDQKDILELAKYAAKSADYLQSKETFEVFYNALTSMRVYAFSGVMKMVYKKIKLGLIKLLGEKEDIEYFYYLTIMFGKDMKYHVVYMDEIEIHPIQANAPPAERTYRTHLHIKHEDYFECVINAGAYAYNKELFQYVMNRKIYRTDKTYKDFGSAWRNRVDYDYFRYITTPPETPSN